MSAGIVLQNYNGISEVSTKGFLLQHHIMMLQGEITKAMADELVSE